MNRIILGTVLLQNVRKAVTTQQTKRFAGHGVWSYRVPPPPPSKFSIRLAEAIGGICWFWILWHIFTEPEHIIGEYTYIEPSTWTDEELGIPPLAVGSLKEKK